MKKFIILLVFGLLINSVDARFYGDVGDYCDHTIDCMPGLWCWNEYWASIDNLRCQEDKALLGDICTTDDDCSDYYKCAFVWGLGYRCSECEAGDYIDEYDILSYDLDYAPLDSRCNNGYAYTCSCVLAQDSDGSNFFIYSNQDDFGDTCRLDTDCFGSLFCNQVQNERRSICVDDEDYNCGFDSDCGIGYHCVANECVDSAVSTTSTTISTTTTTLPSVITPSISSCNLLYNVSNGGDDAYEVGYGLSSWGSDIFVNDESLISHNTTNHKNYTIGAIFRNVNLPRDVDSFSAWLIMYGKEFEDADDGNSGFFPSWISNLWVYPNNNDAFSDSNKLSDLSYIDGNTGYAFGIAPYSNESWQSFILAGMDWKWNITKTNFVNGDNLTIIVPFWYKQYFNVSWYSFDDNPDFAPRLCINYTLGDVPDSFSECSTDVDCESPKYCKSGFDENYKCVAKSFDGGSCFRNHECFSGLCSSHGLNSVGGDYPVLDYDNYPPYDNVGVCQSGGFEFVAGASPSILTTGQTFTIFGSNLLNDVNVPSNVKNCKAIIGDINRTSLDGTSWAYNVNGGTVSTLHNMVYTNPSTGNPWNYRLETPLIVNSSTPQGSYMYYFQCDYTADGKDYVIGGAPFSVWIYNQNKTFIDLVSEFPNEVFINSPFTVQVKYSNVTGKPISTADCVAELNGQNYTLNYRGDSNLFVGEVAFSSKGDNKIQFFCSNAGYVSRSITDIQLFVVDNHCGNNKKDFDEQGVDCGGLDCQACTVEQKPDGLSCLSDGECLNNWCYNGKCNTPSCNDGIKNGDETKEDCGGSCRPCNSCLLDAECSNDGSQLCNLTYGVCYDNDCGKCFEFTYLDDFGGWKKKTTYCNVDDDLCYFADVTTNQTITELYMDMLPLSNTWVNESFFTVNCEDENNGVKIETGEPSTIQYQFIDTINLPAIDNNLRIYRFGDYVLSKNHEGLINELCHSDIEGFGGLPSNMDRVYAKVRFRASNSKSSIERDIDFVVFRNNLKTSLLIKLDGTQNADNDPLYFIGATNRSIQVMTRLTPNDEFVNQTSFSVMNMTYDHSTIKDDNDNVLLDTFYYRINTSEGEVIDGRYGTPIPMILKYNTETDKFESDIEFKGWMIWVVLAFLILGGVYTSYKIQRRREGVV